MCGICGAIRINGAGKVDPSIIERMMDVMVHRGPDGGGMWFSPDGTVGLGHRRLAIIDLSPLGHQPMCNETGDVYVTFNGEIYNFPELRVFLEGKGHKFRSGTDTETLVHLYEEKGDALFSQLDGDFAFGLWDERNRRLLLGRDRAGVKPLYFAQVKDWLLFASEIKALLATGLVKAEIDEEALYHYLSFLVSPSPMTLVRGVSKLPIGTGMYLDQKTGKISQWRYWEPLPGQAELDLDNLDAQAEDLFNKSVRKRLLSDVPVGAFFSGGVDSTLNVISFQKEIAPAKVRTFNVGMTDAASCDESDNAREMARLLGTEHHEIKIDSRDWLDNIRMFARFQDEPISDPVCIPLFFVSKLARETGTIVVHAGEGADEIFCGYRNYERFLRHNSIFWEPLCRLPSYAGTLFYWACRPFGSSPLMSKIADVLQRRGKGQEFFMASAVAFYESEKQRMLSKGYKERTRQMDSFEVVRPLYERIRSSFPSASFLQCMTFIELNMRLPELLLMRADKMSMANSIELRVPFLDHRLIEFAITAPESFKLRNGIPKEPLKRLAARHVPANTVYKPKRGFGAPIREWFMGELGEHFREIIADSSFEADRFFNTKAILDRLRVGPKNVNQAFQLWVMYNFLNWKKEMGLS